jgi:hypothetical protein
MRKILILSLLLLAPLSGWGAWGAGDAAGTVCSEAASTSSISTTFTGGDFNVGNVAIIVCASDNTGSSDGNSNEHNAASDSSGNTYTKLYEYTEGTGGAAGGATVSVHYAIIDTQVNTPFGTIQCNFASSVTDKCITGFEFTIGAGNTVSLVGSTGEASNGGDAGSLSISGLSSAEYLFVRGIATESNAATSMTATASYTRQPSDGCSNTLGGGEASDMGACSEYRIFTGTGDTSDPTLVDTTNDNASVYVALQESAPAATTGQGWWGSGQMGF